jgi:hypothetical protein
MLGPAIGRVEVGDAGWVEPAPGPVVAGVGEELARLGLAAARITAAICVALAPGPMRTTTPATSSSIPAAARSGRERRDRRVDPRDGSALGSVTTAGTKAIGTAGPGPSRARRACLRQPKTCCGVSPWRRATTDTTAPGTSVSSRIAALASADHSRRPAAPLMISIRRGSNVGSNPDTRRSSKRIVTVPGQAASMKVPSGRRLQPILAAIDWIAAQREPCSCQ